MKSIVLINKTCFYVEIKTKKLHLCILTNEFVQGCNTYRLFQIAPKVDLIAATVRVVNPDPSVSSMPK